MSVSSFAKEPPFSPPPPPTGLLSLFFLPPLPWSCLGDYAPKISSTLVHSFPLLALCTAISWSWCTRSWNHYPLVSLFPGNRASGFNHPPTDIARYGSEDYNPQGALAPPRGKAWRNEDKNGNRVLLPWHLSMSHHCFATPNGTWLLWQLRGQPHVSDDNR